MKNLEMNRAKEKLKNSILEGGGIPCSFRDLLCVQIFYVFLNLLKFQIIHKSKFFQIKKPQLFESSVGWDIPSTIFSVLTQRARFFAPNVNMWHFVSTYKRSNKVAKKFLTSISICCVQEKNPFSFFSQICLFQTFYSHIYPQNVKFFYMAIQMKFKQK